ncbi:Metallo-dependent phosphatase [Conidiobolus coronatus NRRL 28638]|uniref:Metallo-dependent phosphatase n=1 Tax=Conidiobolus coronatus (strain ATCC 28846 / CBS 209.66 / NRRL 28638) TaxID=796925 RepID=A0A137PHR9_CONC2|nr:Metallo-dependent phosphatase [Conidiobolus coronatus NRRL 28638]|eukprot:KXN74530.1 Metallo-dependent phosphatase [Conidiobolus coronatus NRRL 28638]
MKFLNCYCLFIFALSAQIPAPNKRVIAIGDLHGDYEQAVKVLQMANLVDENAKWIGKNDTLVQTGDIVDRGPHVIKLYKMMQRLTKEASAAGGKVVQLLGNHELMNMMEDYRYVTKEDIDTFGGLDERKKAFTLEGWVGKYLRNLGITAVVDDTINHDTIDNLHKMSISELLNVEMFKGEGPTQYLDDTVYAHGGITPKWAEFGVEKMNQNTISDLHRKSTSQLKKVELFNFEGPTQYRGYARDAEPGICKTLETALKSMRVNRMVLGHTVQQNGKITSRCGGRIILIDVGISKYKRGNLAALELTPGHAKGLYPNGKSAVLPVPSNLNHNSHPKRVTLREYLQITKYSFNRPI